MKRSFFPAPSFEAPKGSYSLLPFRFMRLDSKRELLVNEAGEFVIAPSGTVRELVGRGLDSSSSLFRTLKAKHFLFTQDSSPLLDVLAAKYRSKRAHLKGFTQLHMFVVTLRCEHTCQYCQVSRQTTDKSRYDMSQSSADKALSLMFRSPAADLVLEFQGGEPLLNFDLVRYIVEQAEIKAEQTGKILRKVIASNIALLTREHLQFMKQHEVDLSISLDGPAQLHNSNRPRPGNDSHERVEANLAMAREVLGFDKVSALMTTTRRSLEHPVAIIDEYRRLRFPSIFLRRLSPYGFAVRTRSKTGYDTERFLEFYRQGLEYIIQLNRAGTYFVEVYTKLLLTKILTPFATTFVDLQSPAGAGIKAVSYNYDGDVYASDESRMLAEMDDTAFRLGNVHENTYEQIFGGSTLRRMVASSCVESLPGCNDCALQVYCGGDPVFNHATQGDLIGHRPTSSFCRTNMTIMQNLFRMIATEDAELMRIFMSWIRNMPQNEMFAGTGTAP